MKYILIRNPEGALEVIFPFKYTYRTKNGEYGKHFNSFATKFEIQSYEHIIYEDWNLTKWETKEEVKLNLLKRIPTEKGALFEPLKAPVDSNIQIIFPENGKAVKRTRETYYYMRLTTLDNVKEVIKAINEVNPGEITQRYLRKNPEADIEFFKEVSEFPKDILCDFSIKNLQERTLLNLMNYLEKVNNGEMQITDEIKNQLKAYMNFPYVSHPSNLITPMINKELDGKERFPTRANPFLQKMHKEILAFNWLSHNYSNKAQVLTPKVVAAQVNAFEFAYARLNLLNSIEPHKNPFPYDEKYLHKQINDYIVHRKKYVSAVGRKNLWKTIGLGILFLPSLFSTLDKRKALLQQLDFELKFLDEFQRFHTHRDRDGCILDHPKRLYRIGRKLLDEKKPDFAVIFLSKVRPDQKNYELAMNVCMCYYRAQEDKEWEQYYNDKIKKEDAFSNSLIINEENDNQEAVDSKKSELDIHDLYQELKQELVGDKALPNHFKSTNSSGLTKIKEILEKATSPDEGLAALGSLGRAKIKPGLSLRYSHSSMFGKGRHQEIYHLYIKLAQLSALSNASQLNNLLLFIRNTDRFTHHADPLEEGLCIPSPIC